MSKIYGPLSLFPLQQEAITAVQCSVVPNTSAVPHNETPAVQLLCLGLAAIGLVWNWGNTLHCTALHCAMMHRNALRCTAL